MLILKTASALNKLRINKRIVDIIHEELKPLIYEGNTADTLETKALEIMKAFDAQPAFLGYRGYPYSICVSINEEIIHGFPSKDKIFREGDVVSVDVGVHKYGYHGDAAFTKIVGQPSCTTDRFLVETTKKCLSSAAKAAKPGVSIGTLGRIIEEIARKEGFGVVTNYVGHNIGRSLHEDPQIPNYHCNGPIIKEGMCICIEPMLTIGSSENHILEDGWTVVTNDHTKAAHEEWQIII